MTKPKIDPARLEAVRAASDRATVIRRRADQHVDKTLGALISAEQRLKMNRDAPVSRRGSAEAAHAALLKEVEADVNARKEEWNQARDDAEKATAAQQEAQALLRACEAYAKECAA